MKARLPFVLAIAAALSLATAADAAVSQKKRHASRHAKGVGFLPGYRTPEQIRKAENRRYWYGGRWYWYDPARFYRGRWNGGSFGPCWTSTPIGMMWNCGK